MKITGLTRDEVQSRVQAGQTNISEKNTGKTVPEIFFENIFTYFNFIFLVLSILVIIAGKYRSLTMTVAVIFNMIIGIVQELRAKRILDKVAVLNQPVAAVIRDGESVKLPIEQLVLGDYVVFRTGSQICADAEVVEGEIDVNESLLTGEADEIKKTSGDKLYSGSFVITGECVARLTAVGADSYIAGLTKEARAMKGSEHSEMVKDVNRFVLFAGIAIIPIGLLLFFFGLHTGLSFSDSINSMVAAVVGMIPEGLYVLVTLTLALAVMLHDMKSIETLARVDVLCVDKTGTITEPVMQVTDLLPVPGVGKIEAETLLSSYISSMNDDNPTMTALRDRFPEGKSFDVSTRIPFTSRLKYSGLITPGASYCLGAPDILLGASYNGYEDMLKDTMEAGRRVIVLARADIDQEGNITGAAVPITFVALENPIRENAESTFSYFSSQGVAIKVISGDNPLTVSRVARSAGIENAENYIDASELREEADYDGAVEKYTVFGRVKPDQKKYLIQALKKKGHYVAMTGDGVNDIMAMKAADCSVAMAEGSDAAVNSAQIVLMDSDFSHMPGIVSEGRRVIGNIERSATLFLNKNLFSMLMAVYVIITLATYPLLPAQVSLVSGFNIGIPAFFLALEPNEKRQKGRFMFNVLKRAIPAALTTFVMMAVMTGVGGCLGISFSDLSVASLILMSLIGFTLLIIISRPLNRYRIAVLLGSVAGFILCAVVLAPVFELHPVSLPCALLCAAACALSVPLIILIERVMNALIK